MPSFEQAISEMIWDIKYRYRLAEQVKDRTVEATWHRAAKAIARAEKPAERKGWEEKFFRALEGFSFLPGGRILAGAGTRHRVTLFNCFVMDIPEDSLQGIFMALEEGALTLQQGGGVGYDFSLLRPDGDITQKTGLPASGPVSFMRVWDTMCGVLLSTGARRGAMMGVLRCDHPDIEAFVEAKVNPSLLRHFNVSVMVTDAFMAAVKKDEPWALVFPVKTGDKRSGEMIYRAWIHSREPVPCRVYRYVRARELWRKIIRAAYDYAEPGVLFADTINRMNNLWYREQIHATNPCGEIPLPAYGACDLGALNLTRFVESPFSPNAALRWSALEDTAAMAARFLDNVIDVSRYPLKAQQEMARGTRRIGLGVTGLADTLVMLGMRYGDAESITFARDVMKKVAEVTWRVSAELAREKGAFPYFHPDYLRGEFVTKLPDEMRALLSKDGVRNSHHNTIAPAGTISLYANNVSNGIEPIFRAAYQRHVRMPNNETVVFEVEDAAYRAWRKSHTGLPPAWVDAGTLQPDAHLQVQGAMQPFIDNAISKTINIPADFPFERLMDVYDKAYAMGLKGCTIFRPNPVTGSVLETHAAADSSDQCCQR